MQNLRRSARQAVKPVNFSQDSSYPDGPPTTQLERQVARLNGQSFHSDIFSHVDDILVFAIFSTKRRPHGHRALKPHRAFYEVEPPIQLDEAAGLNQVFNRLAKEIREPETFSQRFVLEVKSRFPTLIRQKSEEPVWKHLAARYYILHHAPESEIKIEKIQFHDERMSGGLQATRDIVAASVILSACSSLSSNIVHKKAISVIQASRTSAGQEGPRLILGPFRFANQDCDPNCQIMAVPKSHAFTFCALRNIKKGESITVRYTDDGSYFEEGNCQCKTCRSDSPPDKAPVSGIVIDWKPKEGKKRKRGGKRAKRKRPAQSEVQLYTSDDQISSNDQEKVKRLREEDEMAGLPKESP